jgi:hypothetical protein
MSKTSFVNPDITMVFITHPFGDIWAFLPLSLQSLAKCPYCHDFLFPVCIYVHSIWIFSWGVNFGVDLNIKDVSLVFPFSLLFNNQP